MDFGKIAKGLGVGIVAAAAADMVENSDFYKEAQAKALKDKPDAKGEQLYPKALRYGAAGAVVLAASYFGIL